jgi:hypothetical protein
MVVDDENTEYQFYSHICKERNVGFFEIIKPFTDLPYTVVVRNYSERGYLPLFTDLFICQSWGVCGNDILFLGNLWKYLKMDGVFDMDLLLKNAVEKCFPREGFCPEPEPVVYRRYIYQVLETLQKNEVGR